MGHHDKPDEKWLHICVCSHSRENIASFCSEKWSYVPQNKQHKNRRDCAFLSFGEIQFFIAATQWLQTASTGCLILMDTELHWVLILRSLFCLVRWHYIFSHACMNIINIYLCKQTKQMSWLTSLFKLKRDYSQLNINHDIHIYTLLTYFVS